MINKKMIKYNQSQEIWILKMLETFVDKASYLIEVIIVKSLKLIEVIFKTVTF